MAEIDESFERKVEAWLQSEGYPLEYLTADIFRSKGFTVSQGWHTRGSGEGKPRELDVVASLTRSIGDAFLRCEFIVECKWSGDKPWVLFTSETEHMARTACMAQTISDDFGSSILWLLSEGAAVELSLFENPGRPAFGGRQVFGKADLFYSSIASVTSACVSEIERFGYNPLVSGLVPDRSLIAFPLIVVDGPLFEARYDSNKQMLGVVPADRVRCHWRGSAEWRLHSTVDIVSRSALNDFVADRFDAVTSLLDKAAETYGVLRKARDTSDPSGLVELIGERINYAPKLIKTMLQAFRPRGFNFGDIADKIA